MSLRNYGLFFQLSNARIIQVFQVSIISKFVTELFLFLFLIFIIAELQVSQPMRLVPLRPENFSQQHDVEYALNILQ